MKMADAYNLKPVWDELISIYKAMEAICDKHGIRCYGAYGTALGAVRHKGFIPWDDDLDVVMPRRDYMLFLKVAESELPEYYRIKSPYNSPDYPYTFSKVVETRIDRVAEVQKRSNLALEQGLFVDIFPFDGYPSGVIGFNWWLLKRAVLRRFSKMSLLEWEKWYQKYDYDTADCVHWLGDNSCVLKQRNISPKTLGKGVVVPFAGTTIKIPSDCDTHLRGYYGDYMKLPPERSRHPSHQLLPLSTVTVN